MKKAVPVRIPEWPKGHLPTSQQLQTYLLLWDHQRNRLEPDPGAGLNQKSFWLDLEDLDVGAYEAECFRSERLDRAQFIRRIIATYHKGTPTPPVTSEVVTNSRQIASPICRAIASTSRQALRTVSSRSVVPVKELSPSEVNEVSRMRGLGICWQPGNVYRVGKAVNGKSCLVQIDLLGRELARYGSW